MQLIIFINSTAKVIARKIGILRKRPITEQNINLISGIFKTVFSIIIIIICFFREINIFLRLFQGITLEHLEMLGPLICHTIRPLVFRAGLWTIELEKSWNHLFEMVATLMKRGYPGHPNNVAETNPLPTGIFPTLTHTLILKDTWAVIVEQMHELGLSTFVKLFRLSANLR